MSVFSRLRRAWEDLLTFGAFSGESSVQRGKRRIIVGGLIIGMPIRVLAALEAADQGLAGVVVINLLAVAVSVAALIALRLKPDWWVWIINAVFFAIIVEVLSETIILGGLVPSSAIIVIGLLSVIGALIALSIKAAIWWLIIYVVAILLAVVLPNSIEPIHVVEASAGEMAGAFIGATVLVFAGMAYFVRQRDRLQAESDDLLHNILPDEIAKRLKSERTMIADDYESASVLFADLVNFTPMSAGMSPPELVGLLNSVFTTFDSFVEELGLEKIKTVGDEYMVAAGVPERRPDHAHAIAELALRIRDHTESNSFDGQAIRLRIGINSGPVVAGIVGTHKFAYDLWGDVVNTASRMESEGIAGSIQLTEATYDLIKDGFVCEPRGVVSIKGKGAMSTYLLLSRNMNGAVTS